MATTLHGRYYTTTTWNNNYHNKVGVNFMKNTNISLCAMSSACVSPLLSTTIFIATPDMRLMLATNCYDLYAPLQVQLYMDIGHYNVNTHISAKQAFPAETYKL